MNALHLPRPISPGTRVRIRQTIQFRHGEWPCEVEGVVIEHAAIPTASWFAHMPRHRLWLNRLRLQKDDGEITLLNLDEDSVVTVLAPDGAKPASD